jgi:S1-C subfamily serine protease
MGPFLVAAVLLAQEEIPVIKSDDFTQSAQVSAVSATVQIRNPSRKTAGSGVLMGKNGPHVYVLTANHIVEGEEGLEVAVFSADSYPKPKAVYRTGRVVAAARGLADLALVRLTTDDPLPEVRLCPAKQLPTSPGFPGLTVGCAGGDEPTCLLCKVAGKTRARRPNGKETALVWEIDEKLAAGRSGGPLLDKRGFLLGICSGTNGDKTYFTHAQEIINFLRREGFRRFAEEKAPD